MQTLTWKEVERKEIAEVKVALGFWGSSLNLLIAVSLLLTLVFATPCLSQGTDAGCGSIREHWEKVFQELRDRIQDFATIQQTPVPRITQKPLYDPNMGKTIASQVGEALQTKEEILSTKRRECRDLMTLEEELFPRLQECGGNGKNSKDKDVKGLQKRRQALLDKAIVITADVREVEGKETVLPYSEAMGNQQDDYRRSVNNYWQTYQQMYRRWSGY
jgi:hypothetical protein